MVADFLCGMLAREWAASKRVTCVGAKRANVSSCKHFGPDEQMTSRTSTVEATTRRLRPSLERTRQLTPSAKRCRDKFLRFFPGGFRDETYQEWERDYKWEAHERFCAELRRGALRSLLDAGDYLAIAKHAVTIEARTNLLFSFEKMALRDALKSRDGARAFAEGLYEWLYGRGSDEERFEAWVETVGALPRRQTRVLTWPIVTIFGMIAEPEKHIFVKPMVTRAAAAAYGCEFRYTSRPSWGTYVSMLEFAEQVREDQTDLAPRDMIDLQSFIWVQGSDEYEE